MCKYVCTQVCLEAKKRALTFKQIFKLLFSKEKLVICLINYYIIIYIYNYYVYIYSLLCLERLKRGFLNTKKWIIRMILHLSSTNLYFNFMYTHNKWSMYFSRHGKNVGKEDGNQEERHRLKNWISRPNLVRNRKSICNMYLF